MTIAVIGAGVVGMACARALQRAGQDVLVLDPEPPGSGCSHGNAGVIATEHVLPLARPQVIRRVPAMLGDRQGPLYLKPGRLPGLLPWLARMARAGLPDRVRTGSRALANLVRDAVPAWREELASCAAGNLLEERGSYLAYETPRAYAASQAERRSAAHHGVVADDLDAREVAQRLPALGPVYRALYYPDSAHVLNPRAVVEALDSAFQGAGGRREVRRVRDLEHGPDSVVVRCEDWQIEASHAVIACGWQSRPLAAGQGCKVPLGVEMGYHVSFAGLDLAAPVAIAGLGFMATPMAGELRVAGTVEFARTEAPPDWRRAEILERHARRLFIPELGALRQRWRGCRPTVPDFLPVIGPLADGSRVFAAFAHQHIGLTTATVTGGLIRDLILGRRPQLDPAPYSPRRF